MIQDNIVRQHKLKNDAAMNAWLERNAIVNHETKKLSVEDNIDHFKVNIKIISQQKWAVAIIAYHPAILKKLLQCRGLFTTQSNIYDRAFLRK